MQKQLWTFLWCTVLSISTVFGQNFGLYTLNEPSSGVPIPSTYNFPPNSPTVSSQEKLPFEIQNSPFKPHFGFGLSTGFIHYQGDVYSKLNLGTSLSYGASLYLHFTPWLKARASVAVGSISGNDNESSNLDDQAQNLNFRNRIQELSLLAEWDFFPWLPSQTSKAAAFIFTGFTFFKHNPQSYNTFASSYINLRDLNTEGQNYSLTSTAIPIGIGGRYEFAKRWTVSLQAGIRFTLTDYIDDVGKGVYLSADALPNVLSRQYANRTLESRPALPNLITNKGVVSYTGSDGNTYSTLAGFDPGTQRGRVAGNDKYFMVQLTISTYFGRIPRLLPN